MHVITGRRCGIALVSYDAGDVGLRQHDGHRQFYEISVDNESLIRFLAADWQDNGKLGAARASS